MYLWLKKGCLVGLICYLSLFLIDGRAYAGAGDNLTQIVKGSGQWLASGALTKTIIGGFKNGKFFRLGFTPVQIGTMLGLTAAGSVLMYAQDEWFVWLGLNGDKIRKNGSGLLEYKTAGGGSFSAGVEAALANFRASFGSRPTVLTRYATNSAAGQGMNAFAAANPGCTQIAAAYHPYNGYIAYFHFAYTNTPSNSTINIFAYDSSYAVTDTWVPATSGNISTEIVTDLNGSDANHKALGRR
jgi:hypothetical protein